MRDRFEERTNKAVETVKNAMDISSRALWNCDPKKHEKGRYVNKTEFELPGNYLSIFR